MKKIKLTLRWRITLLTIAVMLVSSIVLVVFININTSMIMPQVTNVVLSAAAVANDNGPSLVIPQSGAATLAEIPGPVHSSNSQSDATVILGAMETAATDMYWGSFVILLVTIAVGGACAYYVSGSALRPIKSFNENIKRVNANNLTSNLSVDGPQDEIKELAISFNSMLAKLENAFSSQKRFNASIAHEFKTPLAVVKANIDVLNDQDEKVIEDYRRTLSIVEQSVNKMNASVEALLDAIQEENATLDDDVKVDDLISDVAEDLKLIAEKNEIHFTCEIKPVPIILGNEVLLYRAIYNVVENAIKYNKPQGNVTVSCNERNHQIEIGVSDTGNGITEKEIKNIFKPFYRIKNHSQQDGLGLGLALTKSVIAIHGGEICVKSIIGQGTVFEMKLPIR